MALSEEELRRLAELEASLLADDPQLAKTLNPSRHTEIHRRSATLAGVGFLIGIILLLVGLRYGWYISVAGFIAMFGSTVVAVNSWKFVDGSATATSPDGSKRSSSAPRDGFMDRMEERWRKRHR